ncbi:MAG: hypothetical protein ACJA10_001067, partial [Oleispira sp.]
MGTTDSCTALDSATFNCAEMLNDIVEHSVEPLIADFSTKVQALKTTTTQYCSSLSTPTSA